MNTIASGDYEINFIAQLPSEMPSSFYFKDKKKNKWAPIMKLGYYAQATLKCTNSEYDLSHRKKLIIREKPQNSENKRKFSAEAEAELKTWGCCIQGSSKLESKFTKNVIKPKEIAEAAVSIDNSRCNLKVKSVSFYL